ncbi:MAG: helix-turn-helix domain-containing protein [Aestuariivirga sp.]
MIIALLLFAFLVHRLLTRETHVTLLALIAACAVQSVIVALVQYYGVTSIRPLQPLLATLIPPIAWLAFSQAARGDAKAGDLALHSAGFVLALLLLLLQPQLLDVLIPLLFAGYGIAMMVQLGRGEDSLPHSQLESGTMPLLTWRIIAVSLIASAASDVFIAYNLAVGEKGALLWMPSVFSSLTLLSLGAVSLSHAMESRHDDGGGDNSLSPEDSERDQSIVTKLDEYVQTQRPFLDPDLTLARLSRRLLVPAKQLSAAINRVKGENVSRYINRHRIDHASGMILGGRSVTEAMLSSGFNTKSNFNREFLRVKGENPSKWVESQS